MCQQFNKPHSHNSIVVHSWFVLILWSDNVFSYFSRTLSYLWICYNLLVNYFNAASFTTHWDFPGTKLNLILSFPHHNLPLTHSPCAHQHLVSRKVIFHTKLTLANWMNLNKTSRMCHQSHLHLSFLPGPPLNEFRIRRMKHLHAKCLNYFQAPAPVWWINMSLGMSASGIRWKKLK